LGINEEIILYNKDNIKNIITTKFKDKLWSHKELKGKMKLRYYNEVINPNLEYQKYLSLLSTLKKKINIATIRTNSHDIHSETGCWSILKTPWDELVYHLCDSKRVEDENNYFRMSSIYPY